MGWVEKVTGRLLNGFASLMASSTSHATCAAFSMALRWAW
jgi:hypothetical protein